MVVVHYHWITRFKHETPNIVRFLRINVPLRARQDMYRRGMFVPSLVGQWCEYLLHRKIGGTPLVEGKSLDGIVGPKPHFTMWGNDAKEIYEVKTIVVPHNKHIGEFNAKWELNPHNVQALADCLAFKEERITSASPYVWFLYFQSRGDFPRISCTLNAFGIPAQYILQPNVASVSMRHYSSLHELYDTEYTRKNKKRKLH